MIGETILCTLTVAHEELDGYPTESWEPIFSAARKLKCAWADRAQLVKELLGYKLPGSKTNVEPHVYPYWDPALTSRKPIALKISVSPFGRISDGGLGQQSNYLHAVLDVTYEVPQYTFSGDGETTPLVEETFEGAGEFLTLPNKGMTWGDNTPLEEAEAPGILYRMLDYTYTRHLVEVIPAAALDYMGCVNSAAMTINAISVAVGPETVLYTQPTFDRTITADGASRFNLTYRFTIKPTGWNKYRRHGSTDPEDIYYNGILYKPYPLADLLGLMA